MLRNWVLLVFLAAGILPAQDHNVVLVTADGLRWQEVFRGAEPEMLVLEEAGMKDAGAVVERFGGSSPAERRRKLMPFLWQKIAADGSLFGNRDNGSVVVARNRHRFSYPGYSEILTGRPRDDLIDSNDNRPNPSKTVLEVVRQELELEARQVALFGSWDVFTGIGAHTPGSIFINAGYQAIDLPGASARLVELSSQQFDLLTPWRTVRHDYFTFEMALEYLRSEKPRLLHIALGETDDWAHEKRYDRYLENAQYFDHCLRRLWEAIESEPHYRGRTTLLVATDHGRGATSADWSDHGADVEEARFIWIAALGPGVETVGEARDGPELTQSDIAPSILKLFGINQGKLEGDIGKPIRGIAVR